jgi:hypothetical protein
MMKQLKIALLVTAVLVAGCTALGNQGEPREKPKVVEVERLECLVGGTPCADARLTKYDGPATIRLIVANFGEERIEVDVGKKGRHLMISKCNDQLANISEEGFTVETRGPQGIQQEFAEPDAVPVNQDERLVAEWTLDLVPAEDGNVSELGYQCPMEFRLEFTQLLKSQKQIQIRRDEDVPAVRNLDFLTSSKDPVKLVIDAPESFVPATGKRLVVRSYLENVGPGTVTKISYVRPVQEDLKEFYANCDPAAGGIRMFGGGEREGQSYRRVCTMKSDDNSFMDLTQEGSNTEIDSEVNWLRVEGKYTYRLPLASQRLVFVPVEG